MAYGQGFYVVTINAVDEDNGKGSHIVRLDNSIAPADALSFTTAYAALVQGVCETACVRATCTAVFTDPSLSPAADSDVEDKGVFRVDAVDGRGATLTIPGIKESKLITSGSGKGKDINTDDSAVQALMDAWTDGIGGILGIGAIRPILGSGQYIDAVIEAYKQNRMSHKIRARRKG